jgi:hypothetical protein
MNSDIAVDLELRHRGQEQLCEQDRVVGLGCRYVGLKVDWNERTFRLQARIVKFDPKPGLRDIYKA